MHLPLKLLITLTASILVIRSKRVLLAAQFSRGPFAFRKGRRDKHLKQNQSEGCAESS